MITAIVVTAIICLGLGGYLGFEYGHSVATKAAAEGAALKQAASDIKKVI